MKLMFKGLFNIIKFTKNKTYFLRNTWKSILWQEIVETKLLCTSCFRLPQLLVKCN